MSNRILSTNRFIFLNGPPRSGKDAVARMLLEYNPRYEHEKLSKPLKDGVQAIYNTASLLEMETYKDEPSKTLLNKTFRDAQIELFFHLSRQHGPDVLSKLFIARTSQLKDTTFVISDAGRSGEVIAACEIAKPENCLVFRLHREGTNFDNDIRYYVTNTQAYQVRSFDVDNNGPISDTVAEVRARIFECWGKV